MEAKNAFAYNSATSLIISLSRSHKLGEDGKMHYFLGDTKSPVIKTDINRRIIELSDKVDEDVVEGIKHLLDER